LILSTNTTSSIIITQKKSYFIYTPILPG